MHKRELDESVARLVDTHRSEKRERLREKTRQQMIDEGYIVEPQLFVKRTPETAEERCNRFYGHGVAWKAKHDSRVLAAQEEQRKRSVPKLRGKEEWAEWVARRCKPMERDLIAEANKPVIRVIGSLAPAAAGAAEEGGRD